MIKNDAWIQEKAKQGMISPFEEKNINQIETHSSEGELIHRKAISYGCSSFGYDIRLDNSTFKVFHDENHIIDPKNFNPSALKECPLNFDDQGEFFILPPHTYALGVSTEHLSIPRNVSVICLGKSTYARVGIIVNVTPMEACLSKDTEVLTKQGWKLLKDLFIGEDILTYNPKLQISEYKPITEKQAYFVNSYLNEIKSENFNQLVTDQHKLWIGEKESKIVNYQFTYKFKKAKEVIKDYKNDPSKYKYIFDEPRSCWINTDDELFNQLQNLPFMDSKLNRDQDDNYQTKGKNYFLHLLGIICGIQNTHNVTFSDYLKNNKKHSNKIKECLDKMNVKYEMGDYISLKDNNLNLKIKELLNNTGNYPSSIIRNSSPTSLRSFLYGFLNFLQVEGLIKDSDNPINVYSQNKHLLDAIQELVFKSGFLSPQIENNCISISLKVSVPTEIDISQVQKIAYTGMVYDVTVPPNHIFLCRRQNKISWTGNSWRGYLTIELSNSCSSSCRIYAQEGIAQIVFLEGEDCLTSYEDRGGKYLNQKKQVTLPKV